MPVVFSYFTEFQPKEKRGGMIVLLATFWMCGNIIAAGKERIMSIKSLQYQVYCYFCIENTRVLKFRKILQCFEPCVAFLL